MLDFKIADLASLGMTNDIRKLIATGNNVNEPSDNKDYAIVEAARRNDLPMFKLLKEAGADLGVRNDDGTTCKMWARVNRNQEMLHLISKKGSPKA